MRNFVLILAAVFCFLSGPAVAARGFGVTYGAGSTDRIIGGTTITLGTTLSAAWWQWENGTGGGATGVPFSIGDNGFNHLWAGAYTSSSLLHFERDWTAAFTDWTVTKPSQSAWHHICITYDGGSTSNKPTIYVDGVSVSVTTSTAPSGSLATITQQPTIGNSQQSSFGFNWDGMVAEVGFWNSTLLTTTECAALAKGVSPLLIRNGALTLYAPLQGGQTNEWDYGPNRYSLTVTGALKQMHAPMAGLFGDN